MSQRRFEPPDQPPSSLSEAFTSAWAAIEKATPKATSCIDALSVFPEETSISADRDPAKLPIEPAHLETAESPVANPPSVSASYLAQPHESVRRTDEWVAPVAEGISVSMADAQKVIVAGNGDDLTGIAERVLALEARILTLTAKEQPLADGTVQALELELRGAGLAASLEESPIAADAEAKDISAHLLQVGHIGDRLSTLQARIVDVIAPDQPLAIGEARAGQLEQRGADINTRLEETAAVAERQATDMAERLLEAGHINEQLSALETRIDKLRAPDQPLARGEADARELEQRAAAISVQLEQITAELGLARSAAAEWKRDISARLLEARHIDERLSTLEARIGKLTAPDQPLAVGEVRARQLDQHGAEIGAQLEQYAALTERHAKDMSTRRFELGEFGEQLSALETRIRTALDQPLAVGVVSVQHLEQRSADMVAQFQRCTAVSDAQWADIAQRVAQAAYVGEQLARLEARLGRLIGPGQSLERADGMVEQLEQRMRKTSGELERAIQTQDDRQREVARLREQLESLNNSAGRHIARGSSSTRGKEVTFGIVAGITAVALTAILAPRSPHVATTERSSASNRTSVAAPFTVLPATPLAAAIGAIQMPPTASPGRLNNRSERRIATKKRQSLEPVRRKSPISIARQSSAASLGKAPSSSPAFVGALVIESDPAGSTVFIDRKYVGRTPVQLTELRAGSHVVWILRDGHQRWTASVLVPADKRTHIKAALQPATPR